MKSKLRLICGGAILCVLLGLPLSLSLADSNPEVRVSIDAPAEVEPDSDFTAKVNITEVSDFDACQFDVTYDPSVIEATDVTAGNIGGTAIPIAMWGVVAQGKIRVIGNVPGVPGVTGSGYLAEVHFHVTGSPGDTSDIDLSNGLLGDKYANPITPVTWVSASVYVSDEASPACVLFGDFDEDGDVDIVDIMLVACRWQTSCENPDPDDNEDTPNYDALYDVIEDCVIDIEDIMAVAAHWGETCE